MSHAWKIALLVALVLLFGMVVSLAWSAPQNADETKLLVFSAKDHKLIEEYYLHLVGTLAPGSLDRSEFPLGIEQSLVAGSHPFKLTLKGSACSFVLRRGSGHPPLHREEGNGSGYEDDGLWCGYRTAQFLDPFSQAACSPA